jgi:hydroxyethylthiazole kinase-like uncharacterized protein yjeF
MNNETHSDPCIVLSRTEVRACDVVAIEHFGIPGVVLMENAGVNATRLILSRLSQIHNPRVCIVAGIGNNGGDGYVVARHLHNASVQVDVLICGSRDRIQGDAQTNLCIIEKMALPIRYLAAAEPSLVAEAIETSCRPAHLLVDALLGTGAAGTPREPVYTAIETINRLDKPVVALDIPSGLDCDTGCPMGSAIRAAATITFAAMKKGFLSSVAARFTGEITVASIGIDTRLLIPHLKRDIAPNPTPHT